MKIDNFFSELKRRNVYKVAVAYAIVGWLSIQIATQVFPFLEIPNWVVRLVIVAVAVGLPKARGFWKETNACDAARCLCSAGFQMGIAWVSIVSKG